MKWQQIPNKFINNGKRLGRNNMKNKHEKNYKPLCKIKECTESLNSYKKLFQRKRNGMILWMRPETNIFSTNNSKQNYSKKEKAMVEN